MASQLARADFSDGLLPSISLMTALSDKKFVAAGVFNSRAGSPQTETASKRTKLKTMSDFIRLQRFKLKTHFSRTGRSEQGKGAPQWPFQGTLRAWRAEIRSGERSSGDRAEP